MELYVGGKCQGKLKYVLDTHKDLNETDVADGTSCSDADILSHKIINHFHEYIRRKTDQGEDVTDIPEKLKSEKFYVSGLQENLTKISVDDVTEQIKKQTSVITTADDYSI